MGNFLQLQRLGNDFLELIGIHHLKKLNVKEKNKTSSIILEIIKNMHL